jgi:Plasmid pRiA4b ORF-3-like protein
MSIQRTISGNEIYQIKVTLLRTVPPIWRRLLVPSNLTMSGLHYLLQLAMGWKDCHSHNFQLGGRSYGAIHLVQVGPDNLNESKVRLNQVLPRIRAKVVYTYDFGDCWRHAVVLERCLQADPNMSYPACTGGAGACPPEDCGGVVGFYSLLRTLRNPQHEGHKQLLEWLGRKYDPKVFSIEDVNRALPG